MPSFQQCGITFVTRERKKLWIHERHRTLLPNNTLSFSPTDTTPRLEVGGLASEDQINFIYESIFWRWPACDQSAILDPIHNWLTIFADDLLICGECGRIIQSTPQEWNALDLDSRWHVPFVEPNRAHDVRAFAWSRLSVPEFSLIECKMDDCAELAHRAARKLLTTLWRQRKNPPFMVAESWLWLERHKKAPQKSYACYVYLLHCAGRFKIGHGLSVESRINAMQTGCPFPIELVQKWKSEDAPRVERLLHKRFAEFRKAGEWFELPPTVVGSLKQVVNIDLESPV